MQLCSLPTGYFLNRELMAILLPTLIAICHQNSQAIDLIRPSLSPKTFAMYLQVIFFEDTGIKGTPEASVLGTTISWELNFVRSNVKKMNGGLMCWFNTPSFSCILNVLLVPVILYVCWWMLAALDFWLADGMSVLFLRFSFVDMTSEWRRKATARTRGWRVSCVCRWACKKENEGRNRTCQHWNDVIQ